MILDRYFEDLEQRLDDDEEQGLIEAWKAFHKGRFAGDIFYPCRRMPRPPALPWPAVSINQAIRDFDLMALHQFSLCSDTLTRAGGNLLMVRANYGVGILPSLFGAELFFMDEQTNILPTPVPLTGGPNVIRALIDRGAPKLQQSLGGKTLDMGARFLEIMRPYPKIKRYVCVYHPDLQGPIDVCEMLWGSGLFLDIMDQPDLVTRFLDLISETYIRFMRAWTEIVPFPADGYGRHWGMLHKGPLMLRNDSAMNLSPQLFAEFVQPHDEHILKTFGGGGMHFCGRGSHYIHLTTGSGLVYAVAMSQPEYNDMEVIYRHTVDRGIPLIGFSRKAAETALAAGRPLHGRIHTSQPPSRA